MEESRGWRKCMCHCGFLLKIQKMKGIILVFFVNNLKNGGIKSFVNNPINGGISVVDLKK